MLLLKLIRQKPGILLNILQCIGYNPTAKNYSAQSVSSAVVENLRTRLALLVADNSWVSNKWSGYSMRIFHSSCVELKCLPNFGNGLTYNSPLILLCLDSWSFTILFICLTFSNRLNGTPLLIDLELYLCLDFSPPEFYPIYQLFRLVELFSDPS